MEVFDLMRETGFIEEDVPDPNFTTDLQQP
jgi:hypothetical protein